MTFMSKQTPETPQHNTIKPKRTKVRRTNPDPRAMYAWRQIPITQASINKYIEELPGWVEANPDAKFLTKFYRSHGVACTTWYALIKENVKLKQAYEEAMRELGERQYSNSVDFKANWAPVKHMLHRYAPEFKEADEHHARLRDQNTQVMGLQVVQLPPIERTQVLDDHELKKAKDIQPSTTFRDKE